MGMVSHIVQLYSELYNKLLSVAGKIPSSILKMIKMIKYLENHLGIHHIQFIEGKR